MPRENKKRGRRMQAEKRKYEDGEDGAQDHESGSSKRRKSTTDGMGDAVPDGDLDDAHFTHPQDDETLDGAYPAGEKAFFGMLDEEEQEYFKRADDMLESNSFADTEERDLFLANVYREAEGKELKLAQSQSCSRLLERLIQVSTPEQLKNLFRKFSGNFIHLVTHRFASHCCEALFLHGSSAVTEELVAPGKRSSATDETNGGDVSMENLFLNTLEELEGNIGFLLTERYASHVLRTLLLVLSGEPTDSFATKKLLQSKRKETNFVSAADSANAQAAQKARTVPDSFKNGLEKLIADSVAGLDTEKLRTLASHPNGSPTLQLLLKLELTHYGKQRAKDEASIIRTLLPDDPISSDTPSAKFINGLVYESVGSHLVEKIIEHAPAKMFKSIYAEHFKEKLATLSRNEIAGYVVCRILERLGHDDLLEAHEILVPTISDLLRRNRTMVVRTLIERCVVRNIDTQAIAVQVDATWHGPEGFEIQKLLKYGSEQPKDDQPAFPPTSTASAKAAQPIKTHFNTLAQAMLLVPGSLSALVLDSITTLDPPTLLAMAKDSIITRTIQAALKTRNGSMILTRKLIQHYYGHMGEMALDAAASHVVDCMWEGTHGLAFIRERIAEELAENEALLRDSLYGRAVWKNWKMDLYKRRRADWVRQSKNKASNDGFQSFSELDINKEREFAGGETKSSIQLARERHARRKAARVHRSDKSASSSRRSDASHAASPPPPAVAHTRTKAAAAATG